MNSLQKAIATYQCIKILEAEAEREERNLEVLISQLSETEFQEYARRTS